MANLDIKITKDGSKTLYSHRYQTEYHSKHGALTEALHIYIERGLRFASQFHETLNIIEIGFGTGLNAYLTYKHHPASIKTIHYYAFEKYPVPENMLKAFYETLSKDDYKIISYLHDTTTSKEMKSSPLHPECVFDIHHLGEFSKSSPMPLNIHLIYYDAFGPNQHPELWSQPLFEHLYQSLVQNGIIVTFCAKGAVKRMLKNIGFTIETLQGPPGKREMIRAIKR